MKSYQVNWKITVCSNKLRLIIIRVNRTGRPRTARFRVTHFTEKSSFFFLYSLFYSSETVGRQKMGALVGGWLFESPRRDEWKSEVHSLAHLTPSFESWESVRRFFKISFFRALTVVGTSSEHLREYKMWYTAIFSAAMLLRMPHDYVCVVLWYWISRVSYIKIVCNISKTCKKIREIYTICWVIITGFDCSNKYFY